MQTIRTKVAARVLGPGERLPSIRRLAATLQVSPSTVIEAYDRLVAEGLIHARRGSGFYVSTAAGPPLVMVDDPPQGDRAVDPFWVSRQSLDTPTGASKPGCGWLPDDWMPVESLRQALRALSRSDTAVLTQYSNTRGAAALRRLLMTRCVEHGIEISPAQMLLTGSGTQAIDLICRFLLRPGDTVLVDDPCYFNFRTLLRAHQARVVGVPYTRTGPDVARFEAVVASERPRRYLTNAALHNPTGATLSAQTAHRMLNVAAAHEMTIVEDEIFAEFEPDLSPRLAALDGLQRVVRVGSFSKSISASLRCGYIVARPDWIEDLIDLQIAINFGGPSPVAAELLASILASGGYRRHPEALRRRLAKACDDTAHALRSMGITPWTMPRGGFYLWCRLPAGCDSVVVARRGLEQDLMLAPGNVFSPSQSVAAFMRFNVAHCEDRRVLSGIEQSLQRT